MSTDKHDKQQRYDTMESLTGLAYRLERFNAWRRGDDTIGQPCTKQLGKDIEAAVMLIWREVDCYAQHEREQRGRT